MKKVSLIVFLFSIIIAHSQSISRLKIKGQVVNDSIAVENVIVFNVNARQGAIVKDGFFEIVAKSRDTLVFSSMTFKTKKIIVTPENLSNPFIVKLYIYTTQLKEVKIDNKYNPIKGNTQKIVDKQYSDDNQSHLKNANVYDGQTPGINFVRLLKDVVGLFKKKNPDKLDYFADVSFTELVLSKIKYTYFTNTLKLKDEEVRLFLVYCENDSEAKNLSRYKTSFELMDFLFNKNKEFTVLKNNVK